MQELGTKPNLARKPWGGGGGGGEPSMSRGVPCVRTLRTRVRNRGLAALCVLLAVLLTALGLSVSPTSAQSPEGPSARIWARKLASGNVEFGLSIRAAGAASGTNAQVNNRYLLYEGVQVGLWYNSEAVVLVSGSDRSLAAVQARRLTSGNVEFRLRVYGSEDFTWRPRARYFIYSAASDRDRVVYSSSFYFRPHTRQCTNGAVPSIAQNVGLFRDCETLLASKDALEGTTSALSTWTGSNPMSSWGYIQISSSSRVTRVTPRALSLNGTIPKQLGNLDKLEYLWLNGNNLTGSIPPELGNLNSLKTLQFQGNDLTGSIPSELGNLHKRNMQYIDLSQNGLSGWIPSQLGSLSNLWYLDLSQNGLSGWIPSQLGNLSNMWTLNLAHNNLSGPIPSQLGNLSDLYSLNLTSNNLTGEIPSELGDLSYLETLWLPENGLSGSIPPELGNLSSLDSLILTNNRLSGSIPSKLGDLSYLSTLKLGQNSLSGSIPASLGSLTYLYELHLGRNSLSGNIPTELEKLAPSKGGSISFLGFYDIFRNTDEPRANDNPSLTGCIPSALNRNSIEVKRGELEFCS